MAMHPQTAIAMGQLMQRLAGNPKTRSRALGLVKEIDPNYRLPADVAIADLEARQKAERDKERAENSKASRARKLAGQRKTLLERYSEEDVGKIEALLKKYPDGSIDLEDAAKLYAADTSLAPPSGRERSNSLRHGQRWEFPSIPGLLENPDKAASDMAYSVIDELRGRA